MAKNHFSRADFGSWGDFLGASLYWSQNFDSGTWSAIFGTPKMAKMTPFWGIGGYQKWHFGCPNQNSKTTFQYKLAPKTPKKTPQEPKSDLESDFCLFYQFCIFLSHFPISTDHFFQMQNKSWRSAQIKKLSTQTSFRIKFPIKFQRAGSLFWILGLSG